MPTMDKNTTKFLFTGGHLTPAKAVMDELSKRGFKNIIWVGRKKTMRGDQEFSAEYELIKQDKNIPFVNLCTGKIVRFNSFSTFLEFVENLIKIPIGFIQAFFILIRYRPKVIISFGGYIALPIVICGRLLGIHSTTHEQTTVTGLANKIISRFADKILISWGKSKKYFEKAILTGNPVRKEVLDSTTNIFNLNPKLNTVYVTGGNQGAHIINKAIEEIVEKLLKNYNVIHQTGTTSLTRDYERLDKLSKSFIGRSKGRYIVKGNIYGSEIGEVFEKSNLIISRAGANICSEILATGNLAILIPIPWSINNEQLENAHLLGRIGVGKIIEEKNLTAEMLQEAIEEGMKNMKQKKDFNKKPLKETLRVAKEKIKLDAAERIVDEVSELL